MLHARSEAPYLHKMVVIPQESFQLSEFLFPFSQNLVD